MHLKAITDFYYLEVLRSVNMPFSKASDKWRTDLDGWYNSLIPDLALTLRDYMFLACLGEARHAHHFCYNYYTDMQDGGSREDAMEAGPQYNPKLTLPALSRTFREKGWNSGMGGKRWAVIAEAAMKYGDWKDAVFIDHVAGLEHNGGLMFNKHQAAHKLGFHMGYPGIMYWLDFKFQKDILVDNPLCVAHSDDHYPSICHTTHSLMLRHWNIQGKHPPEWVNKMPLETYETRQYPYKIEWGGLYPVCWTENKKTKKEKQGGQQKEAHPKGTRRAYEEYATEVADLPVYRLPSGELAFIEALS